MELQVFAMVLVAALCHASWNALLKVNGDRFIVMAVLTVAAGAISLVVLPFVPPPAASAWPYIAVSVALHTGYASFLLLAYRKGDLSHVYPLARGLAPILVSLAAVFLVGEELTREGILAVAIIALGVMSLALARGASGFREIEPVLFAAVTAFFIAAYTVVDGLGARVAGTAHGYTIWLFFFNGFPLGMVALLRYRSRTLDLARTKWQVGLLGGLLSLTAYWLVIWALTIAPMAYVSALRETSIVFAVVLGVIILKERLDLVKLAAIAMTTIGTIALKISR